MKLEPTCPCKDCTLRHLACHSSCEGYKQFKEYNEAKANHIRQESYDLSAYITRMEKYKKGNSRR